MHVPSSQEYWKLNTGNLGENGCILRLQTDGNLVLYTRNKISLWSSDKYCKSPCEVPSILALQDDGNLVVYHSLTGYAVWHIK
ncbi:hypothetical protein SELMODRAFT_117471 [Selaginella moellendorffii]|uniref:Bulb-type lectin domain-containing protein n=1 Tax=Selaginella moellendorffii TaxID=88036 RepID=D8SIG3_SELML|nr:hypothetical protein SELMODRAFT_117471 [Selaginella moellendorffii]